MDTVNWGMIGCGAVTERKSAPSFNKIEHSKLCAVMNRTPQKAESYARRHEVPRVFISAEELVNDPGINAVYVATPPSSHEAYAILSMEAGKPVYVEKPMAATYKACLHMLEVSERTGIPIFVAYYRRSMDYFLKVKELLDRGTIGNPVLCTSSLHLPAREEDYNKDDLPWRVIPEISGGGYFHDMGCHELDILMYLLGDTARVRGSSSNTAGLYEPEDTVTASIEFSSGVLYTGTWCFAAPAGTRTDEIEILGDSGSLRFSCFSFSPVRIISGEAVSEFPIPPPEHVQQPMIQAVVDELRGRGLSPSKAESGAEVNRIMEEILGRS